MLGRGVKSPILLSSNNYGKSNTALGVLSFYRAGRCDKTHTSESYSQSYTGEAVEGLFRCYGETKYKYEFKLN